MFNIFRRKQKEATGLHTGLLENKEYLKNTDLYKAMACPTKKIIW